MVAAGQSYDVKSCITGIAVSQEEPYQRKNGTRG